MLFGQLACADVDAPQPADPLPVDYSSRFVEVLSCRISVEHGLAHVLVRAAPEHADNYRSGGAAPFPEGALIVKEQYADGQCRSLNGYTVMRKELAGYDPAAHDWKWSRLDRRQRLLEEGKLTACSRCHLRTCPARDLTCAER